ncbi:hypothetical protein ABW20_dc0106703 [Dactylellina cionopaga]|nr:hypothetical protein ABW20_dc0106703 [Dactylellina cionopaga]
MSDTKNYTVGWICAIQTEPNNLYQDNNHYTLGKIGDHNVVIATLPHGGYGISSATAVVKDMLNSFENIRIGLMVGVGGGSPHRHDIRLGDVVVSSPKDGKGGVVQYDFGKNIQDQDFKLTGFLNQPPALLRAAMVGVSGRHEMSGNELESTIEKALEKYPRLKKRYQRPDPTTDKLYRSEVVHPADAKAGTSCATLCGDDSSKLVSRTERTEDDDNPAIHYGLIASANQLMKNAEIRDKLAAEMDVLCFEMEAAGLMNQFPCLVIRGICDYSDSHKNKDWQGYAAMAAAAYAKDLLSEITPSKIEAEKRIIEIPEIVSLNRWLSPPDPSTNYNSAIKERHEGSGLWFLESADFTEWKVRRNSFLWLRGIPGCGKTVLSSIVIGHLKAISTYQPLYFYFDDNDINKQSLEKMLRVLTSQLYRLFGNNSKELDSLFSSCNNGKDQPTLQSLRKAFLSMTEKAEEVWLVLDALDECGRGKRKELLSWIRNIFIDSDRRNIHLLVTSRREEDIESEIVKCATKPCIVSIGSDLIGKDINAYIKFRVGECSEFERWRSRPKEREKIETVLAEKVNGM